MTDNVVYVDFTAQCRANQIVDRVFNDFNYDTIDKESYISSLKGYANYMYDSGLDEDDIYDIVASIIVPEYANNQDFIVQQLSYNFF